MQPQTFNFRAILIIVIGLFVFSQNSQAGRVVKVKGKKVYIILDNSEVNSVFKNDIMYLTTTTGKKKALIKIKGIKGDKAIAVIGKGKARKGYLTKAKAGKKKKRREDPIEEPMEEASEVAQTDADDDVGSGMMLGIMGAFGTATQNVANVADMSGSSMGFKGIFDYELFSGLGVKSQIGLDNVSVSGNSGSQQFETTISYLAIDLLLRYNWMIASSFGLYFNGGMGIYSPMSTDLGTNAALQEDSISTTSLLIFGAGFVIPFGSWQIQLGGDYLYFPPSEDVDTSVIAAKLGILFEL